jgi:SEC-C motif
MALTECHSNLLAQHVSDLVLDGVFPHQLESRVWLIFPNANFRKGDGDRTVAERIPPCHGDRQKPLRQRRPSIGTGPDQRRTTHLCGVYDRLVARRAKLSDRNCGDSPHSCGRHHRRTATADPLGTCSRPQRPMPCGSGKKFKHCHGAPKSLH